MISSGHYASTHGGLVIYLHEKWSYRIKNYETESQIWENQIIEICDPTYSNRAISQTVFMLSIAINRAEHVYATVIIKHNYMLMCNHKIVINIMLCLLNSTGHI